MKRVLIGVIIAFVGCTKITTHKITEKSLPVSSLSSVKATFVPDSHVGAIILSKPQE